MAIKLPELYRCATNTQSMVSSFFNRQGSQIVGGPSFRRNLNEREFSQFLSMIELLNDVFIPIDRLDKRVWAA